MPINVTNVAGTPISATIKLYQPGSSIVVNTSTINGYGIITSPNATVDLGLEYDSSILNLLIRNLNLVNLGSTLKVTIDPVSSTLPNANFIKAYQVSTSLSNISGALKFKYSSLVFSNEQALVIYKCNSFNKTSNACNDNWIKQSAAKYPNDDIISTEITSFSAYALGESTEITTTTTTTSTTTTTTGSSNNGNSHSYGGGTRTTTTVRTTTTLTECTCDPWSNSGCGMSPCDQTQMKQLRVCNPSGCNLESQCVVDNSCTTPQLNETENKTNSASNPTGLFVLPDLSQYVYPVTGLIVLAVAGIAIWKFNGRIRDSFSSYKIPTNKSSKKGHVTVNIDGPKYLEVKMTEKPKVEMIKPVGKPIINKEAKNRSFEEMRNRALQLDKKMKRK